MTSKKGAATTKYGEKHRQQSASDVRGPMDIVRPIHGVITALRESPNGAYYYEVKVNPDSEKSTGQTIGLGGTWLPLGYPMTEIAAIHGDKDLILGRRVRVDFTSFNLRSGVVYFTYEEEITQPANDVNLLETEAFLYAPAGKK